MNYKPDNKPPISPVSLIIFDMDGVIADTANHHREAWSAYMNTMGKTFTEENFRAIFGVGAKDFCPMLFPEMRLNDDDIKRITEEKEAMFRERARGGLSTYPGFYDFLDLCDLKGIPITVGSSACRANVEFVLNELRISERFVTTVSSDDVIHAKPAPDIFLKAASDAGILPERALVIEDSLMGIAAATAAGMRVAGLATTHTANELFGADFVFENFIDLAELVSGALESPTGLKSGAA